MTLRNRRSPRVDDRLWSRRIACVKRRGAASAIVGLTAFATIESCETVLMALNKASRTDVGTYYGYYGDNDAP